MTGGSGLAVVRVEGDAPAVLDAGALASLGDAAWSRWLEGRRWYGAKGAAAPRVSVVDSVRLPDVERATALVRVDVQLEGGQVTRYQVPLQLVVVEHEPEGALARVETGASARRAWLVDAAADPAFGARIARAYADGETFAGNDVTWRFTPEGAVDLGELRAATVKPLGAEQSNSSMQFGNVAVAKFYRRLEPGIQPEVEMARYLTRSTFRNTPPLLGTGQVVDANGQVAVCGVLLKLVPGATDAWDVAVRRAAAFIGAPGERDPANPFESEARELGRVVGEMHRTLTAGSDSEAFSPVPATRDDVDRWVNQARNAMDGALDQLAAQREAGTLRGQAAAVADAVLRRRDEIREQVTNAVDAIGGDAGTRIRDHGDLHLGQLLRGSDGEFHVIDFEGEPARPLADRRALRSALRDVAGMLRSFAYAAAVAAQETGGVGVQPLVELRLSRWERAARTAFLEGYFHVAGRVRGLHATSEENRDRLLALFEMEKVFYELAYELDNRPGMAWIPLRGIGRILGR